MTEYKDPTEFTPGPKGDTGKEGQDRAVRELEAKLIEMFESGDFAEALQWISKMHNYSLWNRILIATEYHRRGIEGKRHVAGLRAWDTKFKRKVVKGAKAIWIFAPIFSYKNATDGNGNPVVEKGKNKRVKDRLVGYKVVPVFAVQDTEGDPIPEMVEMPLIQSQDDSPEANKILSSLIEHAETMGVPVRVIARDEDERGALQQGAEGYYVHASKSITLCSEGKAGHLAMVMAHELAHHVAHEQEAKLKFRMGEYADHEVVAQGAAYVVCDRLGLDVTEFTLPYVAGWGKNIGRIRRALWFVSKVADGVLPADPQESTPATGEQAQREVTA